jgi:hypothetical protein
VKYPVNSQELILLLISLIRATYPAMLKKQGEGFTVAFDAVEAKAGSLTGDDRLLLKFRDVLGGNPEGESYRLALTVKESARLVATLDQLESLQTWAPDVLAMIQSLRQRLKQKK